VYGFVDGVWRALPHWRAMPPAEAEHLQFQGFDMPAGVIYADEGYAVTKEDDVD